MAAVAIAQVTESVRLKFGIWDALSTGGNWGFSGNEVTYTFVEFEYRYALFDGRLPGVLDIGGAYASEGQVYGATHPTGYGYSFQLEQLIFRENANLEEDRQGLGAFASCFPRFTKRPSALESIYNDFVAGIVYKGMIPNRDRDVTGIGYAWAQLNESGTLQETVVELFYKAQITPRTSLQPDIQYIGSPSGIHRDAIAVGLRFELAL